jgi:hypothetical protein
MRIGLRAYRSAICLRVGQSAEARSTLDDAGCAVDFQFGEGHDI